MHFLRQAHALFEQCRPTWRIAKLIDGDAIEKRILFVEHRMRLAARGEKPRKGEFLSAEGTVRTDGKQHFEQVREDEERRREAEERERKLGVHAFT